MNDLTKRGFGLGIAIGLVVGGSGFALLGGRPTLAQDSVGEHGRAVHLYMKEKPPGDRIPGHRLPDRQLPEGRMPDRRLPDHRLGDGQDPDTPLPENRLGKDTVPAPQSQSKETHDFYVLYEDGTVVKTTPQTR